MSGFPWTTLITATAPVVASLGTVGLTQFFGVRRDTAAAERAAATASERELQDAYVAVIKSGRALSASRRVARSLGGDSAAGLHAWGRAHECERELYESIALVELLSRDPGVLDGTRKLREVTNSFRYTGESVDRALDALLDAIRKPGDNP